MDFYNTPTLTEDELKRLAVTLDDKIRVLSASKEQERDEQWCNRVTEVYVEAERNFRVKTYMKESSGELYTTAMHILYAIQEQAQIDEQARIEKKRIKRKETIRKRKETIRKLLKYGLPILAIALVIAAIVTTSIIFSVARPWIISGTIAVIYIGFWIYMSIRMVSLWSEKKETNLTIAYSIVNGIFLLACIVFIIFDALRPYGIVMAGASVALSVTIYCLSFWGDFDDKPFGLEQFIFFPISTIIFSIGIALFFSGWTTFIIIASGIALAFTLFIIFGSIAEDVIFGSIEADDDVIVIVMTSAIVFAAVCTLTAIAFLFVSRYFCFLALVLFVFSALMSIPMSIIDGFDFDEPTFIPVFVNVIALFVAIPLFFCHYGYEDMTIKDGEFLDYAGEEITIEDSVLSNYYGNEQEVIVPDGVIMIQETAFGSYLGNRSNKVERVTMADSVSIIGKKAFFDCDSLKEVRAPGVTKISAKAFWNCKKLKTIYLSSKLDEIEHGAFENCESLEIIYFDGTEAEWNAVTKYTDNTATRNPWDNDIADYKVVFLK